MVEYGSIFKDIMRIRYGKVEPTPQEQELFNAVSYLGESINDLTTPGLIIRRKDTGYTDHIIVYYNGNDVFHITIGDSNKITNYIPGEWEDEILSHYYRFK